VIDLRNETLLTPTQAARHPALRNPNGRPAHLAKIYRLFQNGALAADGTRVTLEKVRCPGGWRTSVEAIERLVERLTVGGGLAAAPAVTLAGARRRQRQVDEELDRLGIG
jgi:hypothetical protein